MHEPPLSVVIPCWRDEAALSRLLPRLRAQDDTLEILVVDGAASPSCAALCATHRAVWLASSPCRGEQLRQGAFAAQSSFLWFLHADAHLGDQTVAAVRAALAGGATGGFFAFRFAGPACWQSRLLERLINWRCHIGVPYGDQGLFMQAAAYHDCGGFAPWPLFEEVRLVKALRHRGAFVRLPHGLRVDSRRWQRDGWWRRSLRNRALALAHAAGVRPETLARLYSGRRA